MLRGDFVTMNVGMLLFGLFDAGVAFFYVFYMVKSKLGGDQKPIARTLATILGLLAFIVEFSLIVWFNTQEHTILFEGQMVIYLAPIVLSILTGILVLLSQPPKEPEEEAEEENTESDEENTSEEEPETDMDM